LNLEEQRLHKSKDLHDLLFVDDAAEQLCPLSTDVLTAAMLALVRIREQLIHRVEGSAF
jgi:hypothetical protein